MNRFPMYRLVFVLGCLLALGALAILYDLAPGLAPEPAASLADLSFAACLGHYPHWLTCSNSGYPLGDPTTFGLPIQLTLAALEALLRLPPLDALRLTHGLFLTTALICCIAFFRRFGCGPWIALLGALLFLASPIVSMEGAYGPLRIGFALLPGYVLVNLAAIAAFERKPAPGALASLGWCAALATTHAFALFCDGYSFVMETLLCGLLWSYWLARHLRLRMPALAAKGSLVALGGPVAAVVLYKLHLPGSDYITMPVAFFRGQGVDLFLLVAPPPSIWLASATGWYHHITPHQAYSSDPYTSVLFVGFSFLACLVVAVVALTKGRFANRGLITCVFVAGLLGLLLSIGPALKVHDFRAPGPSSVLFDEYLMPPGQATLELGTGWLYEHVPGIKAMRSLYRWDLLLRLALVLAACLVLSRLVSGGRVWLAALLALALLAESVPVVPTAIAYGRQDLAVLRAVRAQALRNLQGHVHAGERAVFVQLHPDASLNHYLASYLCALAHLYCYNVGGDKAGELASDAWPTSIFELLQGIRPQLNAREAFRTRLIDVLVVPLFDLRMQAYAWPPPPTFPRDQVIASAEVEFADFSIERTDWYLIVRPKAAAMPPSPVFNEGLVAPVSAWGPDTLQPPITEATYLWVKTRPTDTMVLFIGDHRLPTLRHDDTMLAAPIRDHADQAILSGRHSYPVYLADPARHARQRLGTIQVIPD